MQILFTGVEALAVTAVIAVGLGAVIIVQGTSLLPQFGQIQLLYVILITVITRELGPILTAVIVASRSGTAITTELGNMVINHEVEAYIASGINPIAYLVVPRFLGVIISMVVLNLYFNIFGLLGSWMVTQLIAPVEFVQYFQGLFSALS
ncbi:MAG: ABC transporter permease, partial [Spirochaetaceae bacterium]